MGYIDELTTVIKELKEEKSKLFDLLKNTIEKLELVESKRKELEATKEDWIPVTEDLPKNNFDVLITDGKNYYVGWYNKTKGVWCSVDNRFDIAYYPIVAWKPINQYILEEEKEMRIIAHWNYNPYGKYYICSSCKRSCKTKSNTCPYCNATMEEMGRYYF